MPRASADPDQGDDRRRSRPRRGADRRGRPLHRHPPLRRRRRGGAADPAGLRGRRRPDPMGPHCRGLCLHPLRPRARRGDAGRDPGPAAALLGSHPDLRRPDAFGDGGRRRHGLPPRRGHRRRGRGARLRAPDGEPRSGDGAGRAGRRFRHRHARLRQHQPRAGVPRRHRLHARREHARRRRSLGPRHHPHREPRRWR